MCWEGGVRTGGWGFGELVRASDECASELMRRAQPLAFYPRSPAALACAWLLSPPRPGPHSRYASARRTDATQHDAAMRDAWRGSDHVTRRAHRVVAPAARWGGWVYVRLYDSRPHHTRAVSGCGGVYVRLWPDASCQSSDRQARLREQEATGSAPAGGTCAARWQAQRR